MTQQQTSIPYVADVLKPHDQNLIWVREFGTETTSDLGDAFSSGVPAQPVAVASINARLGTLELNSLDYVGDGDDLEAPQGRTFLLPEWDSFPSPPFTEEIDPDFKAVVLIAHVLLREETLLEDDEQAVASLVLSGETLIGAVPEVPMVTCSVLQADYSESREPGAAALLEWPEGGEEGSDAIGTLEEIGISIYFRIIMLGSDVKPTEIIVAGSRNGLTWMSMGAVDLAEGEGPESVVRRVGLCSQGACIASLDWMRLYGYPITGANQEITTLVPAPPLTGGRLFVP